jgi:hypothetical protein
MFKKSDFIIVGLTTYYIEFLRISIPQIAKLRQKIFLIVHNDNTDVRVTARMIRRLGYRGPLCIINTDKNGGPMQARLNILSTIPKLKIKSEWMIFVDDDDLLLNLEIPNVAPNNYAIMQNMLLIRKRMIDLLRLMDNPENYIADDEHILLERPHIGIVGTLIRTELCLRMCELTAPLMPQIHEIDDRIGTRTFEDVVMWFYIQALATRLDPFAEPIYMDRVNYAANQLDFSTRRYGRDIIPTNMPQEYYNNNLAMYMELYGAALDEKYPMRD